ncbi:MAG: class I SAM-dependent methyltransferase [Bacteroidota bacterium]
MEKLDEVSKKFIEENLNSKVEKLLLQSKSSQPQNIKELAEQIKGKQKIKDKLPTWYENRELIMPKSISTEQASSEITAHYKSTLIKGQLLIDLTGGMGIDFLAMAQNFEKAIYIEENSDLKEITQTNLNTLGIRNAEYFSENSVDFITNFKEKADWIYLDPARRNLAGEKTVLLANCEPNILDIKDLILGKTDNILLKCSPMLDIELAVRQLETVFKIYIITVDNEVKELLFHIKKTVNIEPETKVVHLAKNEINEFDFYTYKENQLKYNIGPIQKYLYEPHAGLMKATAFKTISEVFSCTKLHPNTHLYTSNNLILNFPGRKFEVLEVIKPNKKEIQKRIPEPKANLTIRNFPGTVDQLRKTLGLKDGGDTYLFACTNSQNEKIILQTMKIN